MTLLRRFYPDAHFAAPTQESASGSTLENSAQTPLAAEASSAAITPQVPAPEGNGTVSISSDPDGAEIFIDDKFFGNAPAVLKPSVGSHVILLKMPGRSDWRRTLEVMKGNKTTLKALLDAAP